MPGQSSADRQFLKKLSRFLVSLALLFVVLGVGVYYSLGGSVGLGYLATFFVVAFGIPAGVLVVFASRGGRGGGA